jgi:hypothetical protein
MERMFEGAVEHGAALFRQRFQAAIPSQMLITENAHVRGFRLDGYGMFFDVEVPEVAGTALAWSLRTLDQNDLGLERAVQSLKTYIESTGDTNLKQALQRVELQIAPAVAAAGSAPAASGAREATGAPMAVFADRSSPNDQVLTDPEEAYRNEVIDQIKDAMLQYSGPLTLDNDEWLTVAARRRVERPVIAPADTDARTVIIRMRGGDLAAFRGNRLSREEALAKLEVKIF